MEVVGVCCTYVRNILACLSPSSSISRVSVYHTTYVRECAIDGEVSGSVRRRIKVAFNYLASLNIYNNHVIYSHLVVANTRRFDNYKSTFAVDARHVAPCKNHEVVLNQVEVCLEHLFF